MSIEKLKNFISEIISQYRTDMKFIGDMRKYFANKKQDTNVPPMLFKNHLEVDDLSIDELICISDFLYEKLNQERFISKKYFSEIEISNYRLNQEKPKENISKIIHLEEVRKVSETEYVVPMTAEQLYQLRKNRQYAYFKELQRCSKKIKLANGTVIEKINVNKNGIERLKSRFKDRDRYIVPTEISLTILIIENKTPQYQFIPEYKNTGILNIKVNFDIDSDNYTPVIINDGYHRITALTDAYIEDKENVKNVPLVVGIHVLTEKEAKDLTADTFEQNATDKEWVESLKTTKDNEMVNILIDKSKFLRNNKIENSKREFRKNKNAITYKVLLKEYFKIQNIKFNDDITMNRYLINISKNIDTIMNYLQNSHIGLFNRENLLFEKAFMLYLSAIEDIQDVIEIGNIADKISKLNFKELKGKDNQELIKLGKEL